jgi:RNA polymerase sigma-70 factor, ECF subfamily
MTTTEFSEILEEHYERLRRFVRSRVSNPEEADDLVQEICLRAVSKVDTIRDSSRVESWLFQIARNAIIDHYRRARPLGHLPDDLIDSRDFEHLDTPELSACLPSLFDGLPEPDREALRLTAIDGMKQRELAERLDISLSGAKSRVQRARKRFRELIVTCCHLELDRLGGVINIQPNGGCQARPCDSCQPDCAFC